MKKKPKHCLRPAKVSNPRVSRQVGWSPRAMHMARLGAGLTLHQLSAAMTDRGLPRSVATLHRWEHDASPPKAALLPLSEILGVPTADLAPY